MARFQNDGEKRELGSQDDLQLKGISYYGIASVYDGWEQEESLVSHQKHLDGGLMLDRQE